jgi:hypothetical protein
MSVALTNSQWEAIVVAVLTGETSGLTTILNDIDRSHSLTRYYLFVKWLDLTQPQETNNGEVTGDWPPAYTHSFVSYSPFTKTFVEDFVAGQTTRSAHILCTDDPNGDTGWKEIDVFFS